MKINQLCIGSLCLAGIAAAAGCCKGMQNKNDAANDAAPAAAENTATADNKTLIVYYSKTGNTGAMAALIQQSTGGDIVEIVPVEAYPEDYSATTKQAKKEIEDGFQPPIKTMVENLAQYDTVFVGTPNWWSTIAPPVATFLAAHDLSGKRVVPFVTHGSGGLAKTVEAIQALCPDSTILEAKGLAGSKAKDAKDEIEEWLKKLELAE
jgi:Flavodoxins